MSMLKRFLREAKAEWGWLGLLIVALVCAAVLEVSAPLYLGKIVDAILQGVAAKSDIIVIMKSIDYIVIILIAFYIGHAIFTYFGEYMMATISQNIVLRLRNKMSEHLYKLPMSYFHEHQRGDVLSRLTSDLDSIGETVQEGVPGLISAFIGIVGALAMMLVLSPLLAGCIILVISLGLIILYITSI